MAVTSVSDNFNRSNEALLKSGGDWVGVQNTAQAQVISNAVSQNSAGTATAVWKDGNLGVQMSEMYITDLGPSGTTRAYLIAGLYNVDGITPGTSLNIYSGTVPTGGFPPWYRFRATGTDYELQKKTQTSSATPTLESAGVTPANGDHMRIVYDPATSIVNCYVNDMGTPIISYDDSGAALSDSHDGIGFGLDNTAIIDVWGGSWTTDDGTIYKTSVGDSTQITVTGEAGTPSVSSPTLTKTENFNRTNGWIGASAPWITANTNNPVIVNNRVESTATGTAIYDTGFTGKHSSQIKLITNGNTTTDRAGVLVGVENSSGSSTAGSSFPWYTTGPFYRFVVRASSYALQVKNNGDAAMTTIEVYTPAGGIQSGDIMKATYDPSSGDVECFVNGTRRIWRSESAGAGLGLAPLTGDHSRIGFYLESGTVMDDWEGIWSTSQTGGSAGYNFYELQSGPTEVLLTPYEWDGATQTAITNFYEWTGSDPVDPPPVDPPPTTDLPLVQPYSADALVDSWGINTAWNRDTFYDTYSTQLQNFLIELGTRHIRQRIFQGDVPGNMGFANSLKAAGIKTTAAMGNTSTIMNGGGYTDAELNGIMSWISSNKSFVACISGANEPNDVVTTNWAGKTVAWQQQIFDRFRAYNLHQYVHSGAYPENMYVSGPALKDQDSSSVHGIEPLASGAYYELQTRNIQQYMDRGQIHRYTLQNQRPTEGTTATYPEYNWERFEAANNMAGGKNLDYTEWGFSSTAIDDTAASVYQVRMIVENFMSPDIHRSYTFDLIDQGGDVPWGIINPNLTKKVSFTVIKDFLAKFSDPGTTVHTPPKFGLRITPTPASPFNPSAGTAADGGIRACVLAKRNGTKQIILWRLIRIYVKGGGRITGTTKVNVTIEVDGGSQVVAVGGFPILVNINASNTITSVTNLTSTY